MNQYIFPIFYLIYIVLSILYMYDKMPDFFLMAITLWITSIMGPVGIHFRTKYSLNESGRETKILTLLQVFLKRGIQDLSKTERLNVFTVIGWFLICSLWLVVVIIYRCII